MAEDKGGRPLKFESAEELQMKIEEYFESCHNEAGDLTRPYTITGLALALDTSRKVLLDYEKRDDEYSYTIKKAKLKIENFAEESLFTSKQTAGVIFNLKNNYGWQDKQDVGLSGGLNNTNQDLSSLTAEERRARIDELNRRRGNGASTTT
ncbi:terminase small subunit [Paenibacillus polymyxa]|uniref:terminase small subunit n=1 Tax=Paenibacillus polymyxa TaxID=1406 RepID=UPI00298D4D62|nr:terminase small subunit [Paenibacillus polymyxa]